MVVVISCSHFPDDERIYHKEIKTILEEGYFVKYFTFAESIIDINDKNIIHINYDKSEYSLRGYLKLVEDELMNDPPKVIHIHEPELFLLAIKLKKAYNTKIIYDVHEDYPSMIDTFSRLNNPLRNIKIRYWELKERHFLKYVDEIFIASPGVANSGFVDQGFSPILLENYPLKKFIKKINIKSKKKSSLIYHGNIAPERGISELIKSISIVIKEVPDIFLSIYGGFRTRSYRKELFKLVSSLNLDSHIAFNRHIEHEDIWEHLRENLIGIIPFNDNPLTRVNTPTKLFEYMAAGCHIISSSLPPVTRYDARVNFSPPGDVSSLASLIVTTLNNIVEDDILYNQEKVQSTYNWEKNKNKIKETYFKIHK